MEKTRRICLFLVAHKPLRIPDQDLRQSFSEIFRMVGKTWIVTRKLSWGSFSRSPHPKDNFSNVVLERYWMYRQILRNAYSLLLEAQLLSVDRGLF